MIVIIYAKYKKNPSRTVDATERTRFSKSRSNDLEDIGQGQRSSHATHLLMLVIICTKYGKNPSWTVDATGRTRKVNGQTDRRTDRQTDRQAESYIPPLTSLQGGITINLFLPCKLIFWKATKVGSPPNFPKRIFQLRGIAQPQYFITLFLDQYWTYFWRHYIYYKKRHQSW